MWRTERKKATISLNLEIFLLMFQFFGGGLFWPCPKMCLKWSNCPCFCSGTNKQNVYFVIFIQAKITISAEGRECIVVSNWQPDEGAYSDSTFLMFSSTCNQKFKFICELERAGLFCNFGLKSQHFSQILFLFFFLQQQEQHTVGPCTGLILLSDCTSNFISELGLSTTPYWRESRTQPPVPFPKHTKTSQSNITSREVTKMRTVPPGRYDSMQLWTATAFTRKKNLVFVWIVISSYCFQRRNQDCSLPLSFWSSCFFLWYLSPQCFCTGKLTIFQRKQVTGSTFPFK